MPTDTPHTPAPVAPAPVPTGNTYDKYASTNPIERRMMDGFFAAFDRCLDDAIDLGLEGRPPRTVVEVGAGEGHVTERLRRRFPAARVIGLDLPDHVLADGWRDGGLTMLHGDARSLPFPDAVVDLVVALEVLEHVDGPDAALAELARVASAAVLSVPREPVWRIGNLARGRYPRQLGNTPGHVNHWSARSFGRFVSSRFDLGPVRRPLPWTMLSGRPRR